MVSRKDRLAPLIASIEEAQARVPKTAMNRRHKLNNLHFAAKSLVNAGVSEAKASSRQVEIQALLEAELEGINADHEAALAQIAPRPSPIARPAPVVAPRRLVPSPRPAPAAPVAPAPADDKAARRAALEAELKELEGLDLGGGGNAENVVDPNVEGWG